MTKNKKKKKKVKEKKDYQKAQLKRKSEKAR